MFKDLFEKIKRFFIPLSGASRWTKAMPYIVMGIITLVIISGGVYGWQYTNSNVFCGTACHTMPPQYSTTNISPHARVDCVQCHIGKAGIATSVVRKVKDAYQTGSAMVTGRFEYPIQAHNMRPANDACETCHLPEKFSDDSMRIFNHFDTDRDNTTITTYMLMKTGGGSAREGLGYGIHWHVENPVYFYPEDEHDQQDIPYIRYEQEDGTIVEWIDVEASFDPEEIEEEELIPIDCITCHNRTSHLVQKPHLAVETLMNRGLINPDIPDIRRNAAEVLEREYESTPSALESIEAMDIYYQKNYSDFYVANPELIQQMIDALKEVYQSSVFPEQEFDWTAHADNTGHETDPGCFRCHDGKHLNDAGDAVRLECNLCHSVPIEVGPFDLVAEVEISRGVEPESHLHANFIALHRDYFDNTCENCHTIEDPGGVSNTSFCSNSACHGRTYEFAGFDAPELRDIMMEQLAELQPEPIPVAEIEGQPTFDNMIGLIFTNKCGSCHGETDGLNGLDMTNYRAAIDGGDNGPGLVIGDPDNSLIIQKVLGGHFSEFNSEELALVTDWIINGAPEK
jgi:hypothetical protein